MSRASKIATASLLVSFFFSQYSYTASNIDPTFADIKKIVLENKLTSADKLLEALKNEYPTYLSHHLLAYQSLSLHESSFENPRAIVFGTAASLVLTFNGSPDQRGFGSVEVLSYDKNIGYEFHEVSFLAEGNPSAQLSADETDTMTANVQISKPNPRICLACHTSTKPRPIFEPFSTWPGIYGNTNDLLFQALYPNGKLDPNTKLTSVGNRLNGTLDTEKEGFARYLESKDKNPRYRQLPFPEGLELKYAFTTMDAKLRPNLSFNFLIGEQLAELLVRDLEFSKDSVYNLAFIGAVLCSENGEKRAAVVDELIATSAKWKEQFRQDIVQVLTENERRQQITYDGKLIPLNLEEMANARATFEPSRGYWLAAALNKIGFELSSYGSNRRHLNYFNDGPGAFDALPKILAVSLKNKLRLPSEPTCADYTKIVEKK